MTPRELFDTNRLPLQFRALIDAAVAARRHAYAPYSNFAVGAAVLTATGRVFAGCNVENASSGLTICAERAAIWNAVCQGERDLGALAVVTDTGATPCGACRQVMSEFAVDMPILIVNTAGKTWMTSLKELLPHPFPRADLGGEAAKGAQEEALH